MSATRSIDIRISETPRHAQEAPARHPSGRGDQGDQVGRAELADLAATVNRRFDAPVVRVGPAPADLAAVPTGYPALDAATGLGGFPRGRITELIGRPTSGRESIAARTAAGVSCGGFAAWIDVSGAVDVAHLAECGADLDRLFILRPPRPIDALAIADRLVAAGRYGVVVLDALPDLGLGGAATAGVGFGVGDEAEREVGTGSGAGGMRGGGTSTWGDGTSRRGSVDGAVERFLRVVIPRLGRSETALVILAAPDHPHRALAHAAALRIALFKVGFLRRGGVFRGWRTRAQVLKSPGLQGGESGLEVWIG